MRWDSVLVWCTAVFLVDELVGVVGQLGQDDGELLESQLFVLIQVCLFEELLQIVAIVPALKLGDRTCVNVAPPWAAHPLVETKPALLFRALRRA